jgi:hypothetical protein
MVSSVSISSAVGGGPSSVMGGAERRVFNISMNGFMRRPKPRLIATAHAPRDTHSPRHQRKKPKIGKGPITFTEPRP